MGETVACNTRSSSCAERRTLVSVTFLCGTQVNLPHSTRPSENMAPCLHNLLKAARLHVNVLSRTHSLSESTSNENMLMHFVFFCCMIPQRGWALSVEVFFCITGEFLADV